VVKFVLLHGFWGNPSDFDAFTAELGVSDFWCPNLFEEGPLDPSHSFTGWTNNFLREMSKRFGDEPVGIVGYSQGARLALHAMVREPQRFGHAWLLSANPGQLDAEAKSQRADWIRNWKKKFLEQDWEQLAKDWNRQEVFSGSQEVARPQTSRFLLAQALENWSLLQHQFGWEELRSLKTPTTWVFGASDHQFLAVKERLQGQDVTGDFWVMERAGHRLLQDVPVALARRLKEGY
jgi:2-succinyl-6-hydroxy-2,4-cyclohexadiene-1-carboxylate synthase